MYLGREFVDLGGLMAYGPSQVDLIRRGAIYVDKILRGAKPADLPVEQPNKYEFLINLKTAKTLGLTIPPSLLARADQVIERCHLANVVSARCAGGPSRSSCRPARRNRSGLTPHKDADD